MLIWLKTPAGTEFWLNGSVPQQARLPSLLIPQVWELAALTLITRGIIVGVGVNVAVGVLVRVEVALGVYVGVSVLVSVGVNVIVEVLLGV